MTKVCPETEEKTLQEPVLTVSTDVSFASNHFPTYKLGPDNEIVDEPKEDQKGPSVKETVEEESQLLSDQHKRLSVRDLASKFDKKLAAAVSLADEAKLKEVASLEGHVMLKKLRDALEYMRGRTDGQNKEDVEKAISMVEALAVKLTQNEVNHEKSFACAEIESARAVVLRLGEAFEEQERSSKASRAQGPDVEKMVEEVQEARQIKRMHHPTKVMGMQHELHGLRSRIQEKYMNSVRLHQEIATIKRAEESKSCPFVLESTQSLGSCLKIRVNAPDNAIDLSNCSIQWYRAACETSRREAISGANQVVYAPEPFDVGRILQADILSNGHKVTVTTNGPINPEAGLQSRIDSLMKKSNSEFSVVISQMNGQDYASRSHVFTVGKTRIKLSRGWITKAREIYSTSMQLCGVRGNIKAPAKALFWQPRKSLTFTLTFESEQERNTAVALARKYAFDCNVTLLGPDD
ncbi:hypothetical protein HID58_026496 [Brassica napus]|uniref:Uncharacterized protein n=1 Tax=Brassica napus TaxID=3708 RepID=A0ABQ8CP61_BRANA|nr:hypothetical protein HID58_026496 [Brassica napus]